MYAADEVYTDNDLDIEEVIALVIDALVDRCSYPVGAEPNETGAHLERCGLPAVDDEDEPRCDEHLGLVWP